jgi:hypothetical protein
MKAGTYLLLFIAALCISNIAFGFKFEQIDFPHFDQCAPEFQISPMDSRICTSGSAITALSMAMSTSKPRTLFDSEPKPMYYPNQLAVSLLLTNKLSQDLIFSNTFEPQILPYLSQHMHHTITFTPSDLTDAQSTQFCSHILSGSAMYLVDIFEASKWTTVWLNMCQEQSNDMIFSYYNPRTPSGIEERMNWSQMASKRAIIHEIYISYNTFQQNTYQQWESNSIQNQLDNLLQSKQTQIENIFSRQSESIYSNQLTLDHEWIIPHQYFIGWKQGDYPNDIMTKQSVAAVGCLMCSVAVGLRNRGITLPGNIPVDPSTFNTYIKQHDGYDNDNFIHTVINPICPPESPQCVTFYNLTDGRHAAQDLSAEEIHDMLLGKYYSRSIHVVANVNNGRHFVPIIGWNKNIPTRFKTIDSAGGTYGREWFDWAEIVGWRLYDIRGPFDQVPEEEAEEEKQMNQNDFDLNSLARSIGL